MHTLLAVAESLACAMMNGLLTCLCRKNKNFVDEAPAFNDMSVESNNFVVDS